MIEKLIRYYSDSSIRKKMNIVIVGIAGIILLSVLTIVALESRSIVLRISEKSIKNQSKENSYKAVDYINMKQSSLHTLASSIEAQEEYSTSQEVYKSTIKHLMDEDHDIYAVWIMSGSKKSDSTALDRFISIKDNKNSENEISPLIESQFGYNLVLNTGETFVSNPVNLNGTWIFSIAEPIKKANKVVGVIGFIINTEDLVSIVLDAMPKEDGFCKIVTNDGTIIAHPEKQSIGTKTDDGKDTDKIIEHIKQKKLFADYVHSSTYNGMAYKVFVPIVPEGAKQPWSFCTVVPRGKMLEETHFLTVISIILTIIGILALVFTISFISKKLSTPIINTSHQLKLLSEGRLNQIQELHLDRKDEIGEMIEALNNLSSSQKYLAKFAKEVGFGNLDITIDVKNDQDVIGQSMVEMKQNLINARTAEEKRKVEEDIRSWTITGNARIHELIRKENSSIKHLSMNILQELITYSGSIQGGIFVIDDSVETDQFVDLMSCIAYSRSKMMQKRMPIEEGLIGRCIFEKAPIILSEIPQNYLEITSGLGEKNPSYLAILPLMNNDIIVGALEIASFKRFDDHILEYLLKASESLASAISSVRINERTQYLLEQSKQYAEEMSAQEEELRQNMEEMQAAQEEMHRKTQEYEETINCLKRDIMNLNNA